VGRIRGAACVALAAMVGRLSPCFLCIWISCLGGEVTWVGPLSDADSQTRHTWVGEGVQSNPSALTTDSIMEATRLLSVGKHEAARICNEVLEFGVDVGDDGWAGGVLFYP
jgi:hypothetical protein